MDALNTIDDQSVLTDPGLDGEEAVFDLATTPLRSVNVALHAPDGPALARIENPRGSHSVAVGLDRPMRLTIAGHVGYYAAGMNQHATVEVHGYLAAPEGQG